MFGIFVAIFSFLLFLLLQQEVETDFTSYLAAPVADCLRALIFHYRT